MVPCRLKRDKQLQVHGSSKCGATKEASENHAPKGAFKSALLLCIQVYCISEYTVPTLETFPFRICRRCRPCVPECQLASQETCLRVFLSLAAGGRQPGPPRRGRRRRAYVRRHRSTRKRGALRARKRSEGADAGRRRRAWADSQKDSDGL